MVLCGRVGKVANGGCVRQDGWLGNGGKSVRSGVAGCEILGGVRGEKEGRQVGVGGEKRDPRPLHLLEVRKVTE